MIARALVLLACFAAAAAADPVFKCRDADGRLSYQDKPCPPGTDQPAPVIAPAPLVDPNAAPPVAPPASRPADDVAPAYHPAPPPPATTYRCTDAVSGKSYVSSSPTGSGRYVPLWTVLPGGGTGMKGGGGSTDLQPTTTKPTGALAASYTYVEDRCRPMPVGEQCGYWRQRLDEVSSRKRTAFNDTRPQLEQEEDGLRGNLSTYCQ